MNKSMSPTREWVTHIIALSIIAVFLVLLTLLFVRAGEPFPDKDAKADAFARMKDVLQVLLPLAGTAIGYYVGRVPAENRADEAKQEAQKKGQEADDAKAEAVEAKTQAAGAMGDADRHREVARKAKQIAAESLRVAGEQKSAISGFRAVPNADDQRHLAELNELQKRLDSLGD